MRARPLLFAIAAGAVLAVPLVGLSSPHQAIECGTVNDIVPDFALEDVNPNSPSHGRVLGRDDLLGQVLVMYFAHAS